MKHTTIQSHPLFSNMLNLYMKSLTQDGCQVLAKASMTLGIIRAKIQNHSEGDTCLYKEQSFQITIPPQVLFLIFEISIN